MLVLGDLLKLAYLNFNEDLHHPTLFMISTLIVGCVLGIVYYFNRDDDNGALQ